MRERGLWGLLTAHLECIDCISDFRIAIFRFANCARHRMLDCSWTDEWDRQREREWCWERVGKWLVMGIPQSDSRGSLPVKSNTIFEMPLDISHRPSVSSGFGFDFSVFMHAFPVWRLSDTDTFYVAFSVCVCVYLWFNYCCKFVQQSHKSHSDTHITNFLMENI